MLVFRSSQRKFLKQTSRKWIKVFISVLSQVNSSLFVQLQLFFKIKIEDYSNLVLSLNIVSREEGEKEGREASGFYKITKTGES